ncbi:MAG TPA: nucleoside-diphosphate kinase [bacterium]|nr:nucleoside-diphosphate kinase [bacterium]HPG45944.1 nucleoside-diphosphate kinase [bacterium]HPM97766.1 nucleoside-diphosphate kinase [bacterium]
MQETLAIIKPDAVKKKSVGKIIDRILQAGFIVVAAKTINLTQAQAEGFYAVHRDKPFFANLIRFMCETPIWVMILSKENAIEEYRELMGSTDPQEAASGTLRRDFAETITRNAVHGSDSRDSAYREIAFFFSESERIAAS